MLSIPIIAFGILMLLAGAIILVKPGILTKFLLTNRDNPSLYWIAILVRLLFGGLIVMQSSESRLPVTMEIVGWILVISGFVLMLLRHTRFKQLLSWVLKTFKPNLSAASVFALVFGGLLIYGFV